MNKNELLSVLKLAGNLLLCQLVAVLATLFVTNLITFFSPNGLVLLRIIISVLVYTFLLYVAAWGQAQSDYNKTKTGKLHDNKLRGFVAGLVAALPFFVLALLAFLSESGKMSSFEFLGVDGITAINRFVNLPLGILYNFANGRPMLNFLFPMYMVVISGVAYLLGIFGISLKQIFLYKADEE